MSWWPERALIIRLPVLQECDPLNTKLNKIQVAWVVTFVIGAGVSLLIGGWLCKELGAATNLETYHVFVATTLATVMGVMATGYIFLTETMRRTIDNNDEYSAVAQDVQRKIYGRMKSALIVSTGLVICTFMILFAFDDNIGKNGWIQWVGGPRLAMLVCDSIMVCYIIHLIAKMMNINGELYNESVRTLDEQKTVFDTRVNFVRLNAKEYNALTKADFNGIIKTAYSENNNSGGTDIYFIRGDAKPELENAIAVCDMRDEFETRDILRIFKDIEKILCKIAAVDSETLSVLDQRKIEATLDYDRDFSGEAGISDEIIKGYYELKKYRDCLTIYLTKGNRQIGPDEVSGKINIGADECSFDLILDTESCKNKGKKSKESTEKMHSKEYYLKSMVEPVLLLRFELLNKLCNKTISGIDLSMFDFSYGNLVGTDMSDSVLKEACFYRAVMRCADLSNCDLADVDFRKANCNELILINSVLDNAMTEGASFIGANGRQALFKNTSFTNCSMDSSVLQDALMVSCDLDYCSLSDSNCGHARFVRSGILRNLMLNVGMQKNSFIDCQIRGTTFNGSTFDDSLFNNGTIFDSLFINSKFQNVEFTNVFLLFDDFSNALMCDAKFTGVQLFNMRFVSAQLQRANFTRTLIGSKMTDYETEHNIFRPLKNERSQFHDRLSGSSVDTDSRSMFKRDMPRSSKMTRFDNASMEGAFFVDVQVMKASYNFTIMSGTTLNNTTFEKSVFYNTTFSGSMLTQCSFSRCWMESDNFRDTTLTTVTFSDCNIVNSVFGSKLTGIVFDNCDFDSTIFRDSVLYQCVLINVKNIDPETFDGSIISNVMFKNCTTVGGRNLNGTYHDTGTLMNDI